MEGAMFRLRFPARQIPDWATRFGSADGDRSIETIGRRVRSRGFLTRTEFLAVCAWKSPRSAPRCRENSARDIRTLTRAALASSDEEVKIELLRLLRGVEWATASAILHFCDESPYPILEYRALWSLGHAKPPPYTRDLWLRYVAFTRALAARDGHSMRTLDKALWQYARARQR
jgi:hypothetical protein